MANTINRDMMRILKDTARHAVDGVTVSCGCTWGDKDKPLVWEVNWSACGDQSPEIAREYAQLLIEGAELAEMLTGLEMIEVWEEDRALTALAEEDIDAARRCYENVEMLTAAHVKACNADALTELLLNR